jgi:hypothetical protein
MNTVIVTDGCKESFNETDIHGYTTVFLWKWKDRPSSEQFFIHWCFVVHKFKKAGTLKSDITFLVGIHQRWVLYQEFMFELVLVFELT